MLVAVKEGNRDAPGVTRDMFQFSRLCELSMMDDVEST
jgi:hypothetical protein